ncbi:MAG TPA: type II toxin-antitoxin system VapC family toxin [Anaeromyxobacteraceae bacterium]|nr:type II toxin-antitoxin system VapC family toxin [Anaeromyxobacteraceae bacterium]
MTRVYLETSALLRALLEGDAALRSRLAGASLVTSALTFVEADRAIHRARRDGRLDAAQSRHARRALAALERSCDVLALGEEVLRRAREPLPVEPVRTLDALHLASILLLDAELGGLEVATCDERLRRNVEALGLGVIGG